MKRMSWLLLCCALSACAGKPTQAELDDARQHALFARDADAWRKLKQWAQSGDPAAQRALADALVNPGSPAAWRDAAPWYRQAAEQGDAESAFRLARMHGKGLAGEKNAAQSAYWLGRAAQGGQPDAACLLGLRAKDRGDQATARGWFARAAAKGSSEAMFQLAIIYQEGLGVRPDRAKALDWYQRAAKLEMPGALQTLAMAYQDGDLGLPRDAIKAGEMFNLAAHATHEFESQLF
ncbi:tetratricopeptide repeat protein [Chromobacterium sp. IIBBL 290-4]|uniref:tetratricopeptide repeat protein n=1 Tax=Chromobacterium sp. IIBBL 290-4 TaxID=2953890 RepID=UPI0020B6944C|nr:tetratricopeptide repeat protein [Chromobacterium sp. IIBBL 290-4]UTH72997.1 sel1 repeat family protein [Chromobacterium sp. IIBBL 290-4]